MHVPRRSCGRRGTASQRQYIQRLTRALAEPVSIYFIKRRCASADGITEYGCSSETDREDVTVKPADDECNTLARDGRQFT